MVGGHSTLLASNTEILFIKFCISLQAELHEDRAARGPRGDPSFLGIQSQIRTPQGKKSHGRFQNLQLHFTMSIDEMG